MVGRASTAMIARAELARRAGSLLGVAALVAVVTAAVLAAAVGAHRSATAVERFRTWSHSDDVSYQAENLDAGRPMLAAARADPGVERAGLRYLVNVFPSDGSPDLALMSDPEDAYGSTIDRPRPIEGRRPAIDAPNEVMLNELASKVTGLHVGDRIDAMTWSAEDLDALFSGSGFPGFNGPHLELLVVGIGRTADELSGTVRRTSPYAIGSPAFLAAYPDVGAWPPEVEVRLRDGASRAALDDAMSRIQAEAVGIDDPGGFEAQVSTAADVYLDAARTASDGLVVGLLIFAVVAAVAGGLAIGQAVGRQLAGSTTSSFTLVALGATRSEIALARSWPIAASAALGVGFGVLGAVAASPLLPIGLVRRFEIDHGIRVDPLVLASGGVVILALVWGWALLAASREARRPSPSLAARHGQASARLAARISAAPAVATGLRMAGARRRGTTVPIRSAFVGLALALAGALAAGVMTTSYRELAGSPARWGVPWSSMPDYFGDEPQEHLEAALLRDDRVSALATFTATTLVLEGHAVSGFALDVVKGRMRFTTSAGRLPRSPTEVALGQATLATLGTSIGATVSALPPGGGEPVELTVVGTVVLPATDLDTIDVGAALTPAAAARLSQDEPIDSVVLRFPAGADVAAVERGLSRDDGLVFNLFSEPRPLGSITSLSDLRDVALALAGFLIVLAAAGMAHAMVVSTRRWRHDLATLRALGLRGRQAAGAVLVAGSALAAAGIVVGVPMGLVLGRAVWRALVDGSGALGPARLPWSALAAAAPATALVGALASWWPARSVRGMTPAESLRVE